jgi:Gpi18-like mannosyltransferase
LFTLATAFQVSGVFLGLLMNFILWKTVIPCL